MVVCNLMSHLGDQIPLHRQVIDNDVFTLVVSATDHPHCHAVLKACALLLKGIG